MCVVRCIFIIVCNTLFTGVQGQEAQVHSEAEPAAEWRGAARVHGLHVQAANAPP